MTNDAGLIEELRNLAGEDDEDPLAGTKWVDRASRAMRRAADRLTAQAAVIEGLVEALGPFALVGDFYSDGSLQSAPGSKEVEFCFRVLDFRRASERVSAVRGGGLEEGGCRVVFTGAEAEAINASLRPSPETMAEIERLSDPGADIGRFPVGSEHNLPPTIKDPKP